MLKPKHHQQPQERMVKPLTGPTGGNGEISTRHWSHTVREILLTLSSADGLRNLAVTGGADSGEFCWINDIKQSNAILYHSGQLQSEDIIVDVQGQRVIGYTLVDLLEWIKLVSKNGNPFMVKAVPGGL